MLRGAAMAAGVGQRVADGAVIDAAGTIRVVHVTTMRDLHKALAGPDAGRAWVERFRVTVKNAGAAGKQDRAGPSRAYQAEPAPKMMVRTKTGKGHASQDSDSLRSGRLG